MAALLSGPDCLCWQLSVHSPSVLPSLCTPLIWFCLSVQAAAHVAVPASHRLMTMGADRAAQAAQPTPSYQTFFRASRNNRVNITCGAIRTQYVGKPV